MDDETRERLNRESAKSREKLAGLPGADRSLYYDRQGEPIGMGDWAALRDGPDLDYIVVARTHFDSDLEVSTVWLGIDHNHMMQGPPIIFETMIFRRLPEPKVITWPSGHETEMERESVSLGDLDDADDIWDFQARYCTEAQALAGHKAVCEELERRGHVAVSALQESPRGD